MFEFGFILRAKCSGSSKFDLPMFGEFEVRFFDVRSTSTKLVVDSDRPFKMTNVNKWHRRGNLKGHHFKATAMPEPPYISIVDPDLGTLDGSFVELLQLCSNWMNFTYTLEPPPDKKWGGLQKDGSWNGMIGLLKDELVDIGN